MLHSDIFTERDRKKGMGPPPTPISASLWGAPLEPSRAAPAPVAPAPVAPPAPVVPPIVVAPLAPSQAPAPATNMEPLVQALAHQAAQGSSSPRFGMDFVSILVIILLTALTVYCITLSGRITQLERQCAALYGALASKSS